MTIISNRGVEPIKNTLVSTSNVELQVQCAEALKEIGKHSPDHAKALAELGILQTLLQLYLNKQALLATSDDDDFDERKKPEPQTSCKRALKAIIRECSYLPALYPLLQYAPEKILKYVCAQFAVSLANNPEAKKQFIQSGAFQQIQCIERKAQSKLDESIKNVNEHFPDDMVEFYSPGYEEKLFEMVSADQTA